MQDDDFRPRLGKIGSRGSKAGKRYAGQVRAASNRAGFTGSRVGTAAVLGSRDRHAAFRQRQAMAKARARLRNLQRDGVNRDGAPARFMAPTEIASTAGHSSIGRSATGVSSARRLPDRGWTE
jgi:hypothetical protein